MVEAERVAATADLARSVAFHLHTEPPTYFTVVVAEQALAGARAKATRAAEEEAVRSNACTHCMHT